MSYAAEGVWAEGFGPLADPPEGGDAYAAGGVFADGYGPGEADTSDPSLWPESSATATIHAIATSAVVPQINTLAIAPATGDEMEPITTFEQYRQDREFYSIDFNKRYMKSTGDTECTLIAFGSDEGIDVDANVAIGDPVPLGVVTVSVDDPDGPGLYKAWAQVRTGSGRERTGVVLINVEDI